MRSAASSCAVSSCSSRAMRLRSSSAALRAVAATSRRRSRLRGGGVQHAVEGARQPVQLAVGQRARAARARPGRRGCTRAAVRSSASSGCSASRRMSAFTSTVTTIPADRQHPHQVQHGRARVPPHVVRGHEAAQDGAHQHQRGVGQQDLVEQRHPQQPTAPGAGRGGGGGGMRRGWPGRRRGAGGMRRKIRRGREGEKRGFRGRQASVRSG